MRNFIQPGDSISLTAPSALASGAGFLSGSIFAVAKTAAASGATVEGLVTGVVDLPKAAGAISEGAKVYWDNTAKLVTTTASGNTLIGAAIRAAAAANPTVRVRLNGTVV